MEMKVDLYQQLYRSKPSKNNSLELFMNNIEKELFNPSNIIKTRNNLKNEEKLPLDEMKSWKENVIRVQDQGSGLVVLNTDNYVKKKEQKINKSSFDKLDKHKVID